MSGTSKKVKVASNLEVAQVPVSTASPPISSLLISHRDTYNTLSHRTINSCRNIIKFYCQIFSMLISINQETKMIRKIINLHNDVIGIVNLRVLSLSKIYISSKILVLYINCTVTEHNFTPII